MFIYVLLLLFFLQLYVIFSYLLLLFSYLFVLHKELKNYNKELLEKKIIIAITKCDLVTEKELNNLKTNLDEEIIKISSITGYGLEKLKDAIWNKINLNN